MSSPSYLIACGWFGTNTSHRAGCRNNDQLQAGQEAPGLVRGQRRKEFLVDSVGYDLGLLDSRTAFDCNSELVGACVALGPAPRDQTFLQEPLDQSANCGTIDPCTLHKVGLAQSFVLSDALENSKLPRRDVEVAGFNME